MSDLARELDPTYLLQRMKERGLVERQVKDDKDKKGFWQITSEGRDRLSALPEELESKGIELPR